MNNNKRRAHRGTERAAKRIGLTVAFCLATVLGQTAAASDEFSSAWGPAEGASAPPLTAHDASGSAVSLEGLSGDNGLLLFFNRSTDW